MTWEQARGAVAIIPRIIRGCFRPLLHGNSDLQASPEKKLFFKNFRFRYSFDIVSILFAIRHNWHNFGMFFFYIWIRHRSRHIGLNVCIGMFLTTTEKWLLSLRNDYYRTDFLDRCKECKGESRKELQGIPSTALIYMQQYSAQRIWSGGDFEL